MSIDFPRAWQLAKETSFEDHNPKCSYARTKGGLLCDCEVLTKHPEYLSDVFYGKDGIIIRKTKRMINWICQSNLCDTTGLEQIKEVCEEDGGCYVPYTVIPFENNTSGFPVDGINVFYGSVTWINKLSEEKRAGLFFDKEKFTYLYWGEKYRDLLVNDDFKVITLKEFVTSKEYNNITSRMNREIFFVRPAADNKAFDGHVYQSFQVLDSIGGDPDYLSSLPIIIASPKIIHLEYRLFFVNGKVSSACQYKYRGSLSVSKTIPPDLIPWAEDHLKDFHDVFVADVAIIEDKEGFSGYRLLEFGCANAAGFYGVDVKKVTKDINKYLGELS